MDKLIKYLEEDGCRGVVRSVSGVTVRFARRGVVDLAELLETRPEQLFGATVADRVVGRGAAWLFVKGGVRSVYARVISSGALAVLRRAGVSVEFGTETPFIANRAGDGECPVERLTASVGTPDEAFRLIKTFLENQKQNK